MKTFKLILVLILISAPLMAGDFKEDPSSSSGSGDSSYDPFSDYSEFEEGSDEESNINFFHNGRFFSIGLLGGYEMFTDTLGKVYQPTLAFGGFVSYFFSLRFAMQASYMVANHTLKITDGRAGQSYVGNNQLSRLAFEGKYFFNTQNVTRGLAKINPYLLAGVGSYARQQTVNGIPGYTRDTAYGAQIGLGVEFPLMKGKAFFGAQATYNYVAFADKGAQLIDASGNGLGVTMSGDPVQFVGILGANF